jgi:hypothetical protein
LAPLLSQKPLTEEEGGQVPTPRRYRETIMEHLFTARSLGNNLSWGGQQIHEPDKVVDIQTISYDRKRKAIMKRTIMKRKPMLFHNHKRDII